MFAMYWGDVRLLLTLAAPSVLGYVALWWALPDDSTQVREESLRASAASVRGMPGSAQAAAPGTPLLALRWLAMALLVSTATAVLLGTFGIDTLQLVPGLTFTDHTAVDTFGVLILLVATMCGAVMLGVAPLADLDRARWSGQTTSIPGPALLALAAGVLALLFATSLAALVLLGSRQAAMLLVAALSLTALLALLLVPWGRRLWRGFREETEQRAVIQHHRETSAHLHDSVLQTLVLMQRPGSDEEEMRRLARLQERELRRWLYRQGSEEEAPEVAVRAAVEALTAELEDMHGVDVPTVVVGDARREARTAALLGALREAVTNACRHAKEGIDVFVDIREDQIDAFVRDRGPGVDLAQVPPDRLGVRESIIGRMERAGGTATVGRAPGAGTEVILSLPRGRR